MAFPSMYSETFTAETVNKRVAKGARWLDKHCPGWTLLIDVEALRLDDPSSCILGQTAHCVTGGEVESGYSGSYAGAISFSRGGDTSEYLSDDESGWARAHGFDIQTPQGYWPRESGERYAMLLIAWKEEIRKRGEENS